MIVFISLLTMASLAYLHLMLLLLNGLRRLASPSSRATLTAPTAAVTVVVPFRGEGSFAERLLQALAAQQYPAERVQILLIDDHSPHGDRETWEQAVRQSNAPHIRILQNEAAPGKKGALQTGLAAAAHPWILQTDADTEPAPDWLPLMMSRLSAQTPLVLGTVVMQGQSYWGHFAALDFQALQASGAGLAAMDKPILANGANLGYARTVAQAYPYQPQEPASGDDTFLVQRASREHRVGVQVAAHVYTPAPESYRALLRQRLRWGAKAGSFPRPFGKWVALTVALQNTLLVASVPLGLVWPALWPYVLLFWLLKLLADARVLKCFRKRASLPPPPLWYGPAALLYPFYIVHVLFLLLRYREDNWKGRSARLR